VQLHGCWLAEDLTLGRKVALKLLPTGFAADDVARERFRTEIWEADADGNGRTKLADCTVLLVTPDGR